MGGHDSDFNQNMRRFEEKLPNSYAIDKFIIPCSHESVVSKMEELEATMDSKLQGVE